jgi:type I restriction enzyme S subunit
MILVHTVPAAILRVSGAINQDMKAMFPNNNISPEFLCTSLWAFNPRLLDLVEKSTHDTRKLETEKLLDFAIPVPPPEEQVRIVSKLNELYRKIEELKKLQSETAAELDALVPSILSKAFRGEL